MKKRFASLLHKLRTERKLTQQQLADMLFVDRSSVAHWEIGRRIPDAIIISRISQCLDADICDLLHAASSDESENAAQNNTENPGSEASTLHEDHVMILDPDENALYHSVSVLKETMPERFRISGFLKTKDAFDFAKQQKVCMVFSETRADGLTGGELCSSFLSLNPLTNVIFLTASEDYALKAWETSASGYILKPLKPEAAIKQFKKLKNPVAGLY